MGVSQFSIVFSYLKSLILLGIAMRMSTKMYKDARDAILGPDADLLIDLAFRMKLGIPTNADHEKMKTRAVALGWLQSDGESFTREGQLLGDSLREYVLWQDRRRELPAEGRVPHLSQAHYLGKSVVEIGSGYGSNLLSLRQATDRAVGVEPCAIYHQMSAILCEREQVDPLDLRTGSGERTSLADDSFDVVLCVSAHQYTDIRTMIREIVRILKPGGELQIVGGTIGAYARTGIEPILRGSPRSFISYAKTIANTLSYVATSRRLVGQGKLGTAYPIYPARRRLGSWLERAGLKQARPHADLWPETVFSYNKPSAQPLR